jgi:hypothetical protein
MLEIHYSKDGKKEEVATYDKAADFLAAQYLEVPPFAEYYHVSKATIDGKEVELAENTINGLFNALNK